MATEDLLAVALVIVAGATTLFGFFSTRKAINEHTKLLKSQAELINEAKRKVQSDMHRKASERFEKAVEENAEYLKKDIRHTGEVMNAYVRTEFDGALHNELATFRKSAEEIGKVSGDALHQLQGSIAQEQAEVLATFKQEQATILEDLKKQHHDLASKVDEMVSAEAQRRITQFESEMARIVSSYVNQALASRIDIDAQLAYVLDELEQNKQALVEDMKNVA